jgi:TonB family protein
MAVIHNPRSMETQAQEPEVNIEIEETQKNKQGVYTQAPVLVLSRTPSLVEVIKRAAPTGSRVIAAPDLDKVADQLPTLLPGVLVIDAGCVADISGTVTQLTQHFPELVVVVTGKSEDSAALMRLTAAGQIYRFLLSPLSHGQTKLSLEAAMTQHLELGAAANRRHVADGNDSEKRKNYTVTYLGLGLGLVVLIGGIWWSISKMAGDDSKPAIANSAPQIAGGSSQNPVSKELALADAAFAAGKYLEPPGESALDLYRSALNIDPNNAQAKAGVQQVANKILERAEAALTSEKLEEAVTALEQARDIEPNNSRLQFLDNQISRERERLKLTQVQEVSKKVRGLLAEATQAIEEGRLLTPNGNSARDAVLEARRTDPTDPSVSQALRTLNSRLVDAAKQAADQGQADQAQTYLTAARQLGFAGSELSAIERSLAEARNASAKRASVEAMVSSFKKRIAEGQLIVPAGDSARDLLANIRNADPARADLEELSKLLSTRLIEAARQAGSAKQFDQAQQLIAAAKQVAPKNSEAAVTQVERELSQLQKPNENAEAASDTANVLLPPIPLKRTKIVTPSFPADAKKKGLSGWVEVSFLVASNGSVQEAKVTKADPQGVFEQAALDAVQQWRFEPPLRDGKPATQRTNIRLRFDNQK